MEANTQNSRGKFFSRQNVTIAIAATIIACGVITAITLTFAIRSLGDYLTIASTTCDSANAPLSRGCLLKYANDQKLALGDFAKCLDSGKHKELVEAQSKYAQELQLQGTPSVFIGKQVDGVYKFHNIGNLPYADLKEVIDSFKGKSLDEFKAFLKGKQDKDLADFKQQVVAYFESSEGGNLKGDELQAAITKYLPTNDVLEQLLAPTTVDISKAEKRGKGDIVLLEFSDYECPVCRQFYQETLKQIKADYVDTNQITFAYADYPLDSIHPNARPAAEAARCAGDQQKYFEYHDVLMSL